MKCILHPCKSVARTRSLTLSVSVSLTPSRSFVRSLRAFMLLFRFRSSKLDKKSMLVYFSKWTNMPCRWNMFIQLMMLFYDIWFSKKSERKNKTQKFEVCFLNLIEAKYTMSALLFFLIGLFVHSVLSTFRFVLNAGNFFSLLPMNFVRTAWVLVLYASLIQQSNIEPIFRKLMEFQLMEQVIEHFENSLMNIITCAGDCDCVCECMLFEMPVIFSFVQIMRSKYTTDNI